MCLFYVVYADCINQACVGYKIHTLQLKIHFNLKGSNKLIVTLSRMGMSLMDSEIKYVCMVSWAIQFCAIASCNLIKSDFEGLKLYSMQNF